METLLLPKPFGMVYRTDQIYMYATALIAKVITVFFVQVLT